MGGKFNPIHNEKNGCHLFPMLYWGGQHTLSHRSGYILIRTPSLSPPQESQLSFLGISGVGTHTPFLPGNFLPLGRDQKLLQFSQGDLTCEVK